jgi:hypothetical protein
LPNSKRIRNLFNKSGFYSVHSYNTGSSHPSKAYSRDAFTSAAHPSAAHPSDPFASDPFASDAHGSEERGERAEGRSLRRTHGESVTESNYNRSIAIITKEISELKHKIEEYIHELKIENERYEETSMKRKMDYDTKREEFTTMLRDSIEEYRKYNPVIRSKEELDRYRRDNPDLTDAMREEQKEKWRGAIDNYSDKLKRCDMEYESMRKREKDEHDERVVLIMSRINAYESQLANNERMITIYRILLHRMDKRRSDAEEAIKRATDKSLGR